MANRGMGLLGAVCLLAAVLTFAQAQQTTIPAANNASTSGSPILPVGAASTASVNTSTDPNVTTAGDTVNFIPSSQQRMSTISRNQAGTATYFTLPLSFEANEGQTNPQVKFLSRGSAYTMFLTSEEAVLQLRGRAKENDGAVLHMRLLRANEHAAARGRDELPGKTNYFIGRDPAKWHTNVHTYGKVTYSGIYPGVDLVYYGNQGQLEYDFVVSPAADPDSIAIQFDGAAVEIDSAGDLVLHTNRGEVRFDRPVAYQLVLDSEQNGGQNKRFIDSHFVLRGTNRVAFEVAAYDHSRPLVIDPVLVYSTYLGGSFPDEPLAIAVDSSGSAYVTGITCSADFPVTAGAYQTSHNGSGGACPTSQNSFEDAFVTKFNPAGALVYSTYIGGSASDRGYDIALDSSRNAYMAGQTSSRDYPVTAGAFITTCPGGATGCNTGVVTKLNSTGSRLIYSTYLGGDNNMGSTGIAVNSSGEAYVTGATDGTFPTTGGAYQLSNPRGGAGLSPVFAVLNAGGSDCVYCTFLGGSQGHSYNPGSQAFGVAIDSGGVAYITGWTDSSDFPTTTGAFQTKCGSDGNCNGLWDAFVAKLDPSKSGGASLVYSTFLGGSGTDFGFGIAVDSSGNAYVTGTTGANVNTTFGGSPLPSKDFPTTKEAFQATCPGSCIFDSAWVTKLNASGDALVYSTYLGGANGNTGSGAFGSIALDSAFNAYVTGSTAATDFPTQNPVQQTNGSGTFDAYVTELNPGGSALVFSTYLGGNGLDESTSVALDTFGNIYLTGITSSTKFPTTTGAFQTSCPGSCTYYHGFVSKIGRFFTSTSLKSSLNPSMYGHAVTFTATVKPTATAAATPSGTVTFKGGTTILGTATLASGSGTFTTSTLAAGTHSITAVYGGDATFIGSASGAVAQVVDKVISNTSVASSAHPSQWGATVTFTATVTTPTATIATGTATFKDGATTLGTGALSGGTATFSTKNLAVGSHSITAVYGGDANTLGSTSSILTQTVNKAVTTTTVTATLNPSQFNQTVALKATVKSATGAIPTGKVTFKDGTTTLGTVTLTSGIATLSISKLAVGTHSITAAYGGGVDFAGSTSPAVKLTVSKAKTSTKLTATPNPSTSGQAVTFTATVAGAFGGNPSGTVTFKDGTTAIGTGAVSTTTHQAKFVTTKLSIGTHNITAAYGGNADYLTSTSVVLKQVVK